MADEKKKAKVWTDGWYALNLYLKILIHYE